MSVDDLLVGEDALDFNGLIADGVAELMFACNLTDAFVVSYRRALFCLRSSGCGAKD